MKVKPKAWWLSVLLLAWSAAPAALQEAAAPASAQEPVVYTCPIHPEVQSSTPGPCPKCGREMVVQVKAKSEAAGAEAYTCPMHPEIRTDKPGTCPRCGMTLIPAAPAVRGDFDLRVDSVPRAIKAGQPLRLTFTVFNPATGEQVRHFGVLHEKLFHLFVVSQDMTEFQHIHPTLEPDGRFVIQTVLKHPGHYKVYSDFYPLDGSPQVLQRDLVTAGYVSDLFASQPHLVPDASLTKTLDGMKIELTLDPAEVIGGREVHLKYRLSDAATGAPVRDLTPYLGAWGHTLILSEDQTDYVHSHPVELVPEGGGEGGQPRGGPDVTFEAILPRVGSYRIWTQFLRDNRPLTTVSFTIEARPLTAR